MRETTTRQRAVGALVGLAVGDAVGTTLEFKRPGTFEPITDMVGGGPFGLQPGQWTDDTSLAMCLAESILDAGKLDPADQLRRYVAWRRDGYWSSTGKCFDIGGATSKALDRFERDGKVTGDVVDHEAAANGSLMRLAPVPIRWHADIAGAIERSGHSSRTTHPASRPVDACRALGAMIAALVNGAHIDHVLDPAFWQWGTLHQEVESVMRGSWRQPDIRGSGYVVEALEAAIWAVAGAGDFRDAVLRAANLGEDADTTAAIAGQLAGARWGVNGIPVDWRTRITEADRITGIAGRLHDEAAGVEPDRMWAHDELVHAYWVEPGRVLAGEFAGALDPNLAARKINLLVDHGIRTFVDLTEPGERARGRPLEPYEPVLTRVTENRNLGLERINHPIADMEVIDDAGYDDIVDTVRKARERGGVYVHCWGGIGRTATVVGCLLVDSGMSADAALLRIGELRLGTKKAHKEAPQTSCQIDVIRRREKQVR